MRNPSVRRLPAILKGDDPDWVFDQGNEEFLLREFGGRVVAYANVPIKNRRSGEVRYFQNPEVRIAVSGFEMEKDDRRSKRGVR